MKKRSGNGDRQEATVGGKCERGEGEKERSCNSATRGGSYPRTEGKTFLFSNGVFAANI